MLVVHVSVIIKKFTNTMKSKGLFCKFCKDTLFVIHLLYLLNYTERFWVYIHTKKHYARLYFDKWDTSQKIKMIWNSWRGNI